MNKATILQPFTYAGGDFENNQQLLFELKEAMIDYNGFMIHELVELPTLPILDWVKVKPSTIKTFEEVRKLFGFQDDEWVLIDYR